MLPANVLALLNNAFPGEPLGEPQPTVGGYSNRTAAISIGGRRCVVKAADTPQKRADVRREATFLHLLSDSNLPVAPLLALLEDAQWTVAVMSALPGSNGLLLLEREPAVLPQAYSEIGALLARLHMLAPPVAALPEDLLLGARAVQLRAALPTLALAPDLLKLLDSSLAHPAWYTPTLRLVHGDAGLHNMLWHNGISGLLDWEWAGWGNPLVDLAWLAWTIQWRRLPVSLWQALLAGYGSLLPALAASAPETLRSLALGQMAAILLRTREQPAARDEWLRRIAWTSAEFQC